MRRLIGYRCAQTVTRFGEIAIPPAIVEAESKEPSNDCECEFQHQKTYTNAYDLKPHASNIAPTVVPKRCHSDAREMAKTLTQSLRTSM